MATFIMLPNSTVLSQWDAGASGSGTGFAAGYSDVDDDNGDTQYAFSNTSGERMLFDLVAPSVAEADIDFDENVTVTIKASMKKNLVGTSYVIFSQRGTAADSSSISNGSDTITILSGSYATFSGTGETTSDGSNDWVYGDLAGLQVRLDKFRNDRFGELRVSYLYAEVDYTKTAVVDNATFFGANF